RDARGAGAAAARRRGRGPALGAAHAARPGGPSRRDAPADRGERGAGARGGRRAGAVVHVAGRRRGRRSAAAAGGDARRARGGRGDRGAGARAGGRAAPRRGAPRALGAAGARAARRTRPGDGAGGAVDAAVPVPVAVRQLDRGVPVRGRRRGRDGFGRVAEVVLRRLVRRSGRLLRAGVAGAHRKRAVRGARAGCGLSAAGAVVGAVRFPGGERPGAVEGVPDDDGRGAEHRAARLRVPAARRDHPAAAPDAAGGGADVGREHAVAAPPHRGARRARREGGRPAARMAPGPVRGRACGRGDGRADGRLDGRKAVSSGIEAEVVLDAAVVLSLGMNRVLGGGTGLAGRGAEALAALAEGRAEARAAALAEVRTHERALREDVERNARIDALAETAAKIGAEAALPARLDPAGKSAEELTAWCSATDPVLYPAERGLSEHLASQVSAQIFTVAAEGLRADTERDAPPPPARDDVRRNLEKIMTRLLPDVAEEERR